MEKKSKKKVIIIAVVAAIAVLVGCLIAILATRKESYRLIKVFELEGKATVTRKDIGDLEAYDNMVLESGDSVFQNEGMMTLRMDEDKYVYVEEETKFKLVATGNSTNSKTAIEMEQGAITNEVQNKLSDESTYEINTPNSSMSVRGTVFRIYTYTGEDGIKYTVVAVFEGTVTTRLCYADGTTAENEVSVAKGKQIIIYEDQETTDYLTDVEDIDYSQIPPEVIEKLIEISENGTELSLTTDELKSYLEKGPHTVTFMYNGSVFGTQTVEDGACAQVPTLNPAASGSWDFDFSQPITEDTEINWN